MKEQAVIIERSGRTRHVYLQQEIDNAGGRWATTSRINSDQGWSLYGDGLVVRERYNPNTNERIESRHLYGATWRKLEEAPAPVEITVTVSKDSIDALAGVLDMLAVERRTAAGNVSRSGQGEFSYKEDFRNELHSLATQLRSAR